ncbi:hypothetical protein [Actinomadura sediminis]|uniref:DUF2154 domain-containing protein n=1 Tax=Actinomadura sediminis TaxID=1038904 RepID=A0ABW3EVY2_9ACTN
MKAAAAGQEGVRAERVTVPLPPAPDVARLSFDNGTGRIALRASDEIDALVEAEFAGPLPLVWSVDATVHVEYPLGARLLHRPGRGTVRLSAGVPWAVDVHGGAAGLDADLTGADVRSLAFHAGLAHARIALGRPRGRRTLRFASVDDLVLARPADVPVRIEAIAGIADLRLDDHVPVTRGRGHHDETPGYGDAEDRYLILLSAGASSVTVESR